MPARKTNTRKRATKKVAVVKSFETFRTLFADCVDNERGNHGSSSSISIEIDGAGTTQITIQDDEYNCEYFYDLESAYDHLAVLKNAEKVDVGDYEAKITSEGITVGCTNISLETFDEIAAAVE